MKQLNLRTQFLGLMFAAIASSGGLAACSTASQNQATSRSDTSPAATDAGNAMNHGNMHHSGMNHSGMNHSTEMALGPADAEFDLRFIDAMTPHHQGAVAMAQAAKQKSQRPEIQKLADDIIKAQDQEIAQMKQWRQAWYPQANAEAVAYNNKTGKSMPMSSDQKQSMMMNMDLGAADAEFDLRFINAMIPHHEGAVMMAKDTLNKSKRPEIQKLAKDIVSSQEAEIAQMKQWRKAWYNQ